MRIESEGMNEARVSDPHKTKIPLLRSGGEGGTSANKILFWRGGGLTQAFLGLPGAVAK